MKVGILGSGAVGQALGRGFASRGYDVMIGSRTPDTDKLVKWVEKTEGKGATGTFAETAMHGEILVIAIMGKVAEQVVDLAGPKKFVGKLVIDVTNPLEFQKDAPPGLFV